MPPKILRTIVIREAAQPGLLVLLQKLKGLLAIFQSDGFSLSVVAYLLLEFDIMHLMMQMLQKDGIK